MQNSILVNMLLQALLASAILKVVCILQEDKEAMFDTYDTLMGVLQVATGVLSTLKVNRIMISLPALDVSMIGCNF